MKKSSILLLLVLAFVFAFAFTSCGDPDSAEAVLERIDKKMDSLESYESDLSMQMTFFIDETEVKAIGTGCLVESGVGTDDYYYYQSMTMTIFSDILPSSQETESIEAYNEGRMLVYNKGDGINQKLCSQMTKEAFLEYKEDNDSLDIDFNDCSNADFVKNEDNSWSLTYSGYSETVIGSIVEDLGFDKEMVGAEISDMKISITADEDFRAKQIVFDFVFDVEEDATAVPVFTVTENFSKYNEATRIVKGINAVDYDEVEDVRLLYNVEKMIEDLQNDKDGSFVLDVSQTVTVMGQSSSYKETDTVSYGETDGSYFYDITADVSGSTIDIGYKNGVQTVTQNSASQTVDQTEDEARDFINGLINTAQYNKAYVSDLTKVSDGVYKFQFDKPNSSTYKQALANMGASYDSAKQTITVTIRDNKIVKIESEAEALGKIQSSFGISIEIVSSITFND